MLLQQTEAFQKAQEIYIRQGSKQPGGNTLEENVMFFTYNEKTYALWSVNLITDQGDDPLACDPDEFELDPVWDFEDEDEEFNPDIQESTLRLLICPANEDRDGDSSEDRFVISVTDPLLEQILMTARTQWPNCDDKSF